MILIYNIFTFCNYFINNMIGYKNYYIEYDINNKKYFDEENKKTEYESDDDDEFYCNCNLCYCQRNILFFITKKLVYKELDYKKIN